MSRKSVFFVALMLTFLQPARGFELRAQDDPFDVPVGLEPAVDFWKRVYSDWSENQVVFHDRDDLSVGVIAYEVVSVVSGVNKILDVLTRIYHCGSRLCTVSRNILVEVGTNTNGVRI